MIHVSSEGGVGARARHATGLLATCLSCDKVIRERVFVMVRTLADQYGGAQLAFMHAGCAKYVGNLLVAAAELSDPGLAT